MSEPRLSKTSGVWHNCPEAHDFVTKVEDPVARELLGLALSTVVTCTTTYNIYPDSSVDLLFYVKVLHRLFRKREVLEGALRGEQFEEEPFSVFLWKYGGLGEPDRDER